MPQRTHADFHGRGKRHPSFLRLSRHQNRDAFSYLSILSSPSSPLPQTPRHPYESFIAVNSSGVCKRKLHKLRHHSSKKSRGRISASGSDFLQLDLFQSRDSSVSILIQSIGYYWRSALLRSILRIMMQKKPPAWPERALIGNVSFEWK